jgi:4-amino-4-deoxy-L-arabinose transferase-like glycosyltransferase
MNRNRKEAAAVCLFLILLALCVRFLSWQDNRLDATQVEWGVTAEYKETAQLLSEGQLQAYLNNPYFLTHPPGYALMLAVLFKFFGDSDVALQIIQILCDAAAVIVVFLIVSILLSRRVGLIAGLFVAVSPQLGYYPLLRLPDSVSVLPILLAVYFLIRARRRPSLVMLLLAGAFVGVSCWLRANALLLVFFFAAITPILFERGKRLRYSGALVLGTVLVIAPITIKNLIVFHRFVPLSLGTGQKLLEGIAEYDHEGRFGIPKTDAGIVEQEAEIYHRPDYLTGLFASDGIQRDRMRTARGLAVIRAHPFWYAGVMVRRAVSFFRLARVPIVSALPGTSPAWTVLFRLPLHVLQRLFITACILPLTLFGIALLVRARKWRALAVLLITPIYYSAVQSALHTERRYVIAIHYFLFALAAVPIALLIDKLSVALRTVVLPHR